MMHLKQAESGPGGITVTVLRPWYSQWEHPTFEIAEGHHEWPFVKAVAANLLNTVKNLHPEFNYDGDLTFLYLHQDITDLGWEQQFNWERMKPLPIGQVPIASKHYV